MSNIIVNSTSSAGAVLTYTAPATSDLVDGAGVATCSPASGSTFPVGATAVTCTASDSAGNAATPVSFTVTVIDATPPAVFVTADPSVLLWSPNRTMVPVTVSGTVSDGTVATVSLAVNDEYGQIQPSGTATVTGGAFSFVVSLQAWRQGSDANGRLYTVTVTAADAAGNTGSGSTIVRVPHDQK